jgi:hypothetical protein
MELSREHQARGNEILYDATVSTQYSPGKTEKHDLINDQYNKWRRGRWREHEARNVPAVWAFSFANKLFKITTII